MFAVLKQWLLHRETEASSFVCIIFAILWVEMIINGFWNAGLLPCCKWTWWQCSVAVCYSRSLRRRGILRESLSACCLFVSLTPLELWVRALFTLYTFYLYVALTVVDSDPSFIGVVVQYSALFTYQHIPAFLPFPPTIHMPCMCVLCRAVPNIHFVN